MSTTLQATAAAASTTLNGVDVSSFQHPSNAAINWASVAGAGYQFVAIKATEGNYYVNPYYANDAAAAAAAGMFVAAYHFANPPDSTGAAQADYAVQNAGNYKVGGQYLPLALDLEYDPYSTDWCYGLSPAQMVSWISDFVTEAKTLTGAAPIIYTPRNWWELCTGSSTAFGNDVLWVPAYSAGTPGALPDGWNSWTIWQYTSSGTVAGISGSVDLDYFSGGPQTEQTTVNAPASVQIQTLNTLAGQQVTYTATGLPPGLTINTAGLISGNPTTAGSYQVTVTPSSSSAVLPATVSFTWVIQASGQAPAITSANTATFHPGLASIFTVAATGLPAPTFSETGALPSGVTLGSDGVLSGTPAIGTIGSYPIQITATNSAGGVTQAFTLVVNVPAATTSAPAVLNYSDGTLALYSVRSDGNVWTDSQSSPAGAFSGWQPLTSGGGFAGTPAVVESSSGVIGVYARTTSGAIMDASQAAPGGAAGAWSQIGTATGLVSGPAVLLTKAGVIALYAAGPGGVIDGVSQSAPGGAFGSWQALSGNLGFSGRPAVLQTSSGLIALYARTSAGTLLGTSQHVPGGAFGTWGRIGSAANLASDPTTLLTSGNLIAIYAATTGGAVEGISQATPGGAFGRWGTLSPGLGFTGRPAVLQTPSKLIALYARTSAGTILGTSQHVAGGAFGSWGQLGSAADLASDPAALITTSQLIAIYASDSSGGVAGISQSVPLGPFGTWTEI
jgi:GH25 family lysozyme M1 (1,4-beta-N-acetylmuramidase)